MDEVLATLANEAQTLRSDKADRATLAALLTEMAMRLTKTSRSRTPRAMPDAGAERERERFPDGNGRTSNDLGDGDSFSELRSLIVGPEQRELKALQAHLLDPSIQTRDVSRVLPDAIALRATDPQLTHALAPSIEVAVTSSVRKDPRPLADALFPVMGPAIRKAIAHTLASMMESLNRTVEHSVSWRALQWRWTALRTGKPFAEIVLLNTLQYRVDQVFLVHAETGLLLQQVSSEPRPGRDTDQVSAMLTAIRDFVRDSFKTTDGDTLDALRVGELSVIVEQGPHALLAGVVRGTAPRSLQATFQNALERIHFQLGVELQAFTGDSAPFERARPEMEACLVTQFRSRQEGASYRKWAIAGVVALLAIGAWVYLGFRERQRWNAYLDQLSAEPGIMIASSGRRGGKFFVAGLRDTLARDPASLVSAAGLPADAVESRWEPYQSLHPNFVTARARDLLRPPPGVTLDYRDGVLAAKGSAPDRWIVESERLAPAIAGVRRFAYGGQSPEERLKERLEAMTVQFPKGRSQIAADQSGAISSVAALLIEFNDVLRARGRRADVAVTGHTDTDGTESENGPLSHARADAVLAEVRSASLDAMTFTATGVGSTAPLTTGSTEADMQRNRRASFRVTLSDDSGQRSSRP